MRKDYGFEVQQIHQKEAAADVRVCSVGHTNFYDFIFLVPFCSLPGNVLILNLYLCPCKFHYLVFLAVMILFLIFIILTI